MSFSATACKQICTLAYMELLLRSTAIHFLPRLVELNQLNAALQTLIQLQHCRLRVQQTGGALVKQ